MKRKVGIVTFHAAWNYGAVLQCTALSKKLEMMGYDVSVIDYQPKYAEENIVRNPIQEARKLYRELGGTPISYRVYRSLRRAIRCIWDIKDVRKRIEKRKSFEDFREKYLRLTDPYQTEESLYKELPEFDVYVTGSDQLWNASITNDMLDPVYFLSFAKENKKKIAYAVSACNIKKRDEQQLRCLLKGLDRLSIREDKNKELLQALSGQEVAVCPDPTLLIPVQTYEAMEEPIAQAKPYGLIYLLAKDEAKVQCEVLAQKLQHDLGIQMVDASPNKFCKIEGLQKLDGVSPGAWLRLIHNAEYVLTNSFHCMIFASLYHKDCFILPCASDRMERLTEFAKNSGLEDRIVYTTEQINNSIYNKTDYSRFEEFKSRATQRAEEFLAMSIADI